LKSAKSFSKPAEEDDIEPYSPLSKMKSEFFTSVVQAKHP
jgi:hypothetical protein